MKPYIFPTFSEPEIFLSLSAEPRSYNRCTLLIIDADESLAASLAIAFQNNYNVHVATTSEHGLALAQRVAPDLILTELMMLTQEGMPLCAQLKQQNSTCHIPVILLSEQTDHYSKMKGLYLGADDFVVRPFHFLELQMRIQNLIQSRKMLQQKYNKTAAQTTAVANMPSEDERFLQQVMAVAEKNIENSSFNIAAFAREMGLSRAQLYRRLIAVTGYSANDFMRRLRLQRAAEMLHKKVGNVSEVAYRVGFTSLSYFARCFKEHHHSSPSDYTRQPQRPEIGVDYLIRRKAEIGGIA
ncbi:MAG TPA: helix-turn-helix domain-containing protein [Chryseolinea sp.]